MGTMKWIACFVLAAGCAPAAFADDSGLYIGAGIGSAEHAANVALKPPEVPLMTGKPDSGSRDKSWTFTLGYRVNANIAFELGYLNLGDMKASVADPSGATDAAGRFTFSVEGVTASMLGRFPIGKWTPYVRGGLLFSNTDLDYSASVAGAHFAARKKGDSEDAFFGAGVTYDLGTHWALQFDFTHVVDAGKPGSGQSSYHNATLGMLWRW